MVGLLYTLMTDDELTGVALCMYAAINAAGDSESALEVCQHFVYAVQDWRKSELPFATWWYAIGCEPREIVTTWRFLRDCVENFKERED